MRRRFLLRLALVALGTLTISAAAPAAVAARRRARILRLEAELLDPPRPVPALGTVYMVSIARYRVVKVLKGRYTHSEILVGFDWRTGPPEKAGELHRLVVTDRFPPKAGILNPFTAQVQELGMFYCTRISMVDRPI